MKYQVQNKGAVSSRVAQCKQDKIFVTGEVYPLDIDLLMGDILLILAKVHSTTGNMNYSQKKLSK